MTEWQYPLRRGDSPDPKQGACLLDAVSWVVYGRLGDHPPCVDGALAAYGRELNDWLPSDARRGLKRFVPLLAGTAGSVELAERRQAFILAEARAIAVRCGLVAKGDEVLPAIALYDLALKMGRVPWCDRARWIYRPAIHLLGRAIELGERAAPPLDGERIAEGNRRFLLARAA